MDFLKTKSFQIILLCASISVSLLIAGGLFYSAQATYNNFQLKAMSSEAFYLDAMYNLERTFVLKWGVFPMTLGAYPSGCGTANKVAWDGQNSGFGTLGWEPSGATRFCYCISGGAPYLPAGQGSPQANNCSQAVANSEFAVLAGSPVMSNGVIGAPETVIIFNFSYADLDADGQKQGYLNTDMDSILQADPEDSGSNEF